MALTTIQMVRVEVGDVDPALPILPDDTYDYLLTKNNNSITRASLDAARIILMNLSQRTDEQIDIFSIRGSKAASEYRQALALFISNPSLNPVLAAANLSVFFGGTSVSANQANLANPDNVPVKFPAEKTQLPVSYWSILS